MSHVSDTAPAPIHEELLPGFFRIEVPLPRNPLKAINAYVVMDTKRHLLIDNGFNTPEGEKQLRAALDELGVDLDRTDHFLTHQHSDHVGLTMRLYKPSATVYCGVVDGDELNDSIVDEPKWWRNYYGMLGHNGFPGDQLEKLQSAHPGQNFACESPVPYTPVSEGDILEYGAYRFHVLSVPGHTPGHMALLEEHNGIFVAGDHILASITPNITYWNGVDDSLGNYLQSLKKIKALPVKRTFTGHRQLVENTAERIDQLLAHHDRRLAEACSILKEHGAMSAFDVAARMHWDLRGTWETFRVEQHCFATGEALAHLMHLFCTGKATRSEAAGSHGPVCLFSLS